MSSNRRGRGKISHRRGFGAYQTAKMGVLFALAIALSFLESLVPVPLPVPGIKLGLSNIVTMYAVFELGAGKAYTIVVLKAVFSLIMRGAVASLLGFCGGLLSVTVMVLALSVTKRRASFAAVSMLGALAHNIGQLCMASFILMLGAVLWYYLPLLVASGVVMGLITSLLLRLVLPRLKRDQ